MMIIVIMLIVILTNTTTNTTTTTTGLPQGSHETRTALTGGHNFIIDEMEVWSIM